MGEVFLAEDTRLGRKVALKMLPSKFTDDAERVRRLEQEARAVSSLNHPDIVTIYEVGQEDGRHFIAAEHVEGETLRTLSERGELDINQATAIAEQVAGALSVAHGAGIIHRDIKPKNVMVRPDWLIKVLDFGLAKLSERRDRVAGSDATTEVETTPGMVLGTAAYMSPEQARGEKVDHRTDIFSLGVMLYEMIVGSRPFEGKTTSDVLAAILTKELEPLEGHRSVVGSELAQTVMRCLAKEREQRFQTSGELAADLKTAMQHSKQSTGSGIARRERRTFFRSRPV